MLGENHALVNEFPEFEQLITKLVSSDGAFATEMKKYNALDEEIRKLELQNAPITDESMQEMKHERAVLKDTLYQLLQKAEG